MLEFIIIFIGVGMDEMVLLLSGWRQSSPRSLISDQLDSALRLVAISMTIIFMTDIMMFTIGATCPFYFLQLFCLYSGQCNVIH